MTYDERLERIRRDVKALEDACRTDEVLEACEALKEPLEALESACESEFG